jgi:hypothetical protein
VSRRCRFAQYTTLDTTLAEAERVGRVGDAETIVRTSARGRSKMIQRPEKEEMMHPNFAVKYAVTQWFAFVHLSLAPWSFRYMNHHWDKTRLP